MSLVSPPPKLIISGCSDFKEILPYNPIPCLFAENNKASRVLLLTVRSLFSIHINSKLFFNA